MNDVMALAMFAAKVQCLIVFVSVLKPDGSIGAARTSTYPADCTEASGKADMWARVLPIALARGRQSQQCTSERRALLK